MVKWNSKLVCSFILLFQITVSSYAQNIIDWDPTYQLDYSDFSGKGSRIDGGTLMNLQTSAGIGFSFSMSAGEFMFTKNFNSKVSCSFSRNASMLVAPDSAKALALLNFARYQFDVTELYARKFREQLYLNKGAFSNSSFFHPIYDDIQRQLSERIEEANSLTDMGQNSAKLEELHLVVLEEMKNYAEFCKSCKPTKKKK
jgi:hypothetical protein